MVHTIKPFDAVAARLDFYELRRLLREEEERGDQYARFPICDEDAATDDLIFALIQSGRW